MPVYEYRCQVCGETFDLFVRSAGDRQKTPACPQCGSPKVKKNISLFGVGGATSSGATSSGATAPYCGSGPV